MPPHAAAALLTKRWDLLAEYKDQYWRERKKLGIREAFRVVGALHRQAQLFHPGWPTPEDLEADLQTHIRISAALARTAPGRTRAHGKPVRGAEPRAGAIRRRRRVRKVR
jgi:hypothetical protein